jgi:hypothetical protein
MITGAATEVPRNSGHPRFNWQLNAPVKRSLVAYDH